MLMSCRLDPNVACDLGGGEGWLGWSLGKCSKLAGGIESRATDGSEQYNAGKVLSLATSWGQECTEEQKGARDGGRRRIGGGGGGGG